MVEVYPNRPLALLHDVPFESFAYQTFKSFFLYTVLFCLSFCTQQVNIISMQHQYYILKLKHLQDTEMEICV